MAQRRVNGYGVVKAVSSGDTLVLMGAPKERGQIPPERTIVLTGINAPKFARGKNSVDEAWAWEARELIRKKTIGQQVSFNVQHSAGDRDYGNVFVGEENITHLLLKSGFASLKELPTGAKPSIEREGLMVIEAEAKAAGAGMWAKGADISKHIRSIDWQPSAEKLYDAFHNKPIPAVVSQLRNGSALRCEVAGSVNGKSSGNPFMIVTLSLAGASCPRIPFSEKDKETKDAPEPFALEAVHWVEARLLNRDVQIVIRGIDKTDNVYGEVVFPKGDVTTKLLELGLATYVPWTASMSSNVNALATAAAVARVGKLRLGATAAEEPKAEEMFGKVTFVQSGDTVTFVNEADNSEVKFSIASVRTQRPPRRGEAESAASEYAWDAKEYLRNRLIGQKTKVRALVEYRRTVGGEERMFGSLFLKDSNVGVGLVQVGFAEVVRHKWDEPHSLFYGALMAAERTAVKTSCGMWGKKGGTSITDLTDRPRRGEEGEELKMQSLAAKGASYLLGLKKEKNLQAVVEYCITGGRFKLFVPKEKVLISFSLSGVRTPGPKDPFGLEALEFSRSLTLQKTVRIEVESCDRGCNFIGHMFVGSTNLGTSLLVQGFSSVFGPSADKSEYADEFYAAEEKAKEEKLNFWENFVEKAPEVSETGEEVEAKLTGLREGATMDVRITEISDGASFYVSRVDDPNLTKIEGLMAEFNQNPTDFNADMEVRKGAVVAGLFTDGLWYRVRLEGMTASGEWRAQFMDYGNSDLLTARNIRELTAELAKLPASAKGSVLAGLRGPTKTSEHFDGAAETFHELAFDRVLSAKVECIDKSNKLHLTLKPKAEDVEDGDTTSINQILLREGWCRLVERPEFKLKDLVKSLRPDEENAKQCRYNIWEYGDVSDEDDDDVDASKKRFDGRPPPKAAKADEKKR